MDEPVTGFPFSITGAPMYWGSTMSFLGTAILYGRPAGAMLTGLVFVVYLAALRFEELAIARIIETKALLTRSSPFTAEIYAKRDQEVKRGKKGK